jgi:hypothetical protein
MKGGQVGKRMDVRRQGQLHKWKDQRHQALFKTTTTTFAMPTNEPDKHPSPPLNLAHIETSLNSVLLKCEKFGHEYPNEVNKLVILFQTFYSNLTLRHLHLQPLPTSNPLLDKIKIMKEDIYMMRMMLNVQNLTATLPPEPPSNSTNHLSKNDAITP